MYIIVAFLFFYKCSLSQELTIVPENSTIQEPYDFKNVKISSITAKLNIKSTLPNTAQNIIYTISINSDKSNYKGETVISEGSNLNFNDKKTLDLTIKTSLSDKDESIVLDIKYSYKYKDKDSTIQKQNSTSILVKNAYPSLAEAGNNKLPWNELREAEMFIGKNFDFIDQKVEATDWYGGFRFFLPDVAYVGLGKNKSPSVPRLGLFGGVYQSKSFSKVSYPSLESSKANGTYIFERIVSDTYSSTTSFRTFLIERDSVKVTSSTGIKNLGFYGGFTFLLNKNADMDIRSSIFRIYAGVHLEFIRRNVNPTISFDTLKKKFETRTYSNRGGNLTASTYTPYPATETSTIYSDAYYGITFPIQYRWKDMLHIKLTPTFGYSNNQYKINTVLLNETGNPQKFFYLVQFDALIRAGGLSVNLGTEIRGYVPRTSPIATAYLGTSFSIEKIIDFITK